MSRWELSVVLAVVSMVAADGAGAAYEPAHLATIMGVKGVEFSHVEDGHSSLGSGVGAFYERAVIEGWLDVELSLIGAQVDEHRVVPVDLLAKKPFEINHSFTAYVGGGGTITVEEREASTDTEFGVALIAGVYLWPSEHWGIDVEVDYKYMVGPGNAREVELAAGPVVRF